METTEKTIEKTAVHTGVVHKITPLNSQFGHSWRIEMEHSTTYYLNGKTENLASKLFEIGKKAAFTTKEKANKHGQVYNIVDCVLQTF